MLRATRCKVAAVGSNSEIRAATTRSKKITRRTARDKAREILVATANNAAVVAVKGVVVTAKGGAVTVTVGIAAADKAGRTAVEEKVKRPNPITRNERESRMDDRRRTAGSGLR